MGVLQMLQSAAVPDSLQCGGGGTRSSYLKPTSVGNRSGPGSVLVRERSFTRLVRRPFFLVSTVQTTLEPLVSARSLPPEGFFPTHYYKVTPRTFGLQGDPTSPS